MKDVKACKTRTFDVEGRKVPAVMLGTSPFVGAGQFCNRSGQYYEKFYRQPDNIVAVIVEAVDCGVACVQLAAIDVLTNAFKKAEQKSGTKLASTITVGFSDIDAELDTARDIGASVAFIHANIADRRNAKLLSPLLEKVRAHGLVPGCATHAPLGTISFIEESNLDVAAYLAPINAAGFMMGKEPETLLALLRKTGKTIVAKKPLAAGALAPEQALTYLSSLEWLSGTAIGVASLGEARETFSLAVSLWAA